MVINITINIGKIRGGSKLYLYISVDYKSLFNIWIQRGGIYRGEEMRLENIVFENIRINGEGQAELIKLKPTVNQYMRNKVPGYIHNITFQNISVTGKEGPYKIQLIGADQQHTVNHVIFDGVSVFNQKITEDYSNLEIWNFVSDVSFQ